MRFECSLEEYKKYKLGELVENVVAGATPKTSVDDYWNGGDIPWLSSGEVHKKFIYFTDKFITSEGYNNSSTKIVPTNSVLIALAGQGKTRGTVAINKIELCTNQSIASIIPNEMLNYKYLFYYLESKYEYLRALSSSDGGRGGLNLKLIRSIPIQVPSIKEQENISNFINEIDKKILLLEQKHKLYDDFKKYLMQQIFTQKLRFADDENWVTVTIANIFDNITDYVAAGSFADIRKNVTYLKDPDYAQLIRTADLKSNFTNGDFVYVDKHAFEYLWRVNLDEPCIVLPNIGNIGEVYYINPKELPYSNNALAPNAILLKSNDNIKFKYYLLESPYFKNQLDIINEAGGRGKFNKTNLKKIKIKVPNNDLEKEKIAKCLSNVDNKLKLFNIQLIEMQEFKKGLLQQMFVVRINWRCNFKLAKSPSFNKHLLILKNKIIFIIIK